MWEFYLCDKYYERCLEQANTLCKNRAVEVFKKYIPQLLYTKPVEGKIIMGIDPGYTNGCKCAIIWPNGRMKDAFKISVNNRIYIKSFFDPPIGKKPMNDKGKYYKKNYPSESRRESSVSTSNSNASLQPINYDIYNIKKNNGIPKPYEFEDILKNKIRENKVNV